MQAYFGMHGNGEAAHQWVRKGWVAQAGAQQPARIPSQLEPVRQLQQRLALPQPECCSHQPLRQAA